MLALNRRRSWLLQPPNPTKGNHWYLFQGFIATQGAVMTWGHTGGGFGGYLADIAACVLMDVFDSAAPASLDDAFLCAHRSVQNCSAEPKQIDRLRNQSDQLRGR